MPITEPVRSKKELRLLINFYKDKGQIRNHLLITLNLHTALRISDLLTLSWDDVYDFAKRRFRNSISLCEKKTGKAKTIALHKNIINALKLFLHAALPGRPLIENKRTGKAISRIQAYRLIRAAAEALGFLQRVSCHSLRKSFGYHAWQGGTSPAVIMEIYNHSSFAITRRYLGVAQDDKDNVYLGLNLGDFSL